MESVIDIKPGIYEHFKGGKVKVLFVARHFETLERYVVYEALYECRTDGIGSKWMRSLSMFMQNVVVDGKEMPRFRFVE